VTGKQTKGNKMKLTIEIKNVYGRDLNYPACSKSMMLAKLANKKTLSDTDMTLIKDLGYEIEYKGAAK
jgi:hypothetical protein